MFREAGGEGHAKGCVLKREGRGVCFGNAVPCVIAGGLFTLFCAIAACVFGVLAFRDAVPAAGTCTPLLYLTRTFQPTLALLLIVVQCWPSGIQCWRQRRVRSCSLPRLHTSTLPWQVGSCLHESVA